MNWPHSRPSVVSPDQQLEDLSHVQGEHSPVPAQQAKTIKLNVDGPDKPTHQSLRATSFWHTTDCMTMKQLVSLSSALQLAGAKYCNASMQATTSCISSCKTPIASATTSGESSLPSVAAVFSAPQQATIAAG
eukprot:5160903-Amphidinium_carterae.1